MSANLLAEFDSFYRQPEQSNELDGSPKGPLGVQYTENSPNVATSVSKSTLDDNVQWQNDNLFDPWRDESSVGQGNGKQPFPSINIDDDDWGEFETAQSSATAVSHGDSTSNTASVNESVYGQHKRPGWAEDPPPPAISKLTVKSATQPATGSRRQPRDENVLFDVDNLSDHEEEDDFGDFETAAETETIAKVAIDSKQTQPATLIDFETDFDNSIYDAAASTETQSTRQAPVHTSFNRPNADAAPIRSVLQKSVTESQRIETNSFSIIDNLEDHGWNQKSAFPKTEENSTSASRKTIPSDNLTNQAASKNQLADDPWDDFEAVEPAAEDDAFKKTPPATERGEEEKHNPPSILELPDLLQFKGHKESPVPPTNVPPPAVLLPLFVPILKTLQSALYEPLQKQASSTAAKEIYTRDSTKEFLNSYLNIATILGYIIAGRKLRWKRDSILSQSMRIGPASSGKSSGMKLAGIDKGENLKEDREVADIVKLWRTQVGRLRSAVAAAGIATSIPEISEVPQVRLAQQSEGAISASKACALCCLKRNERVSKVDFDVQDSFGEFWTDLWGHTLCKTFWYSYESQLTAR